MESVVHAVNAVYSEYKTYDPFKLAEKMGALVTEDDLNNLYAYFAHIDDLKIICLNAGLSEFQKMFVLTHCLYHVFTGAKIAVFRKSQYEEEKHSQKEKRGNLFAWLFLARKDEK